MGRKVFSWGTWPVLATAFVVAVVMTSALSVAGQDFKVKQMTAIPGQPEFVPGEILVKFKPALPDEAINRMNRAHETSVIYTSPYAGFKRLRIPPTKTIEEMVEIYNKNPNVEYAEPNAICYAFMLPDDPGYGLQWHFDNAVYGGIHMEAAWDIQEGGNSSVLIGVLDTGVAYEDYDEFVDLPGGGKDYWIYYKQAPDLAGTSFVPGYDFVNVDEHPNDDAGHGTHVTGTIAQTTNNDLGVAGIAFNCSIMPVKVLDEEGSGTAQTLADGLLFAADHGAHIINMSLGWPPGYDPGETVRSAIEYAYNAGVTLVASSGNEGVTTVNYPAAYDEYVIAVGATRYDEAVAYYSNTGASLDLTAPGGDVTVNQNGDEYGDGVCQQTFDTNPSVFEYWFYQGTSMASPHVAGVAALVIANGVTGPDNVRNALQSTAEDHGDDGWDSQYGWGIVDAAAALVGVIVSPTDLVPIFAPGDTIPIVRLAFSDLEGQPFISSIAVTRTGDASDSDVPRVLIYEDTNQDNVIDDKAGPIGTGGSFSGGSATVSDLDGVTLSESINWLVSYDIAPGANTSNTAGCGIGSGDITGKSGTTVNFAGVITGDYSLPVELFSFTASPRDGEVMLRWVTESEVENAWFHIFRSESENGEYVRIAQIKGAGSSPTRHEYQYVDRSVTEGVIYWYKLMDVSYEGVSTTHRPIQATSQPVALPLAYTLSQNYPNPFNLRTIIKYQLPEEKWVSLSIYNIHGQLVRTLVEGRQKPGYKSARWDGRASRGDYVASGIYLYRLVAGEYSQTERMILLR